MRARAGMAGARPASAAARRRLEHTELLERQVAADVTPAILSTIIGLTRPLPAITISSRPTMSTYFGR